MRGSAGLARRIEAAEAGLVRDVATQRRQHGATDAFALAGAGGAACLAAPGSPCKKVAGAGFEPVAHAERDDLDAAFACPVQFEVSYHRRYTVFPSKKLNLLDDTVILSVAPGTTCRSYRATAV